MIEPQRALGHDARQGGVEIAAVREQIRRAISFFGSFAEDHVEANVAGIEVLVVPGAGIEGGRAQVRLEAEAAQDLHGIAADLNAGPDTGEAPGLLVDGDLNADPPQRSRGRKSAHTGTDDCYRKPFHVGIP